MQLLGTQQSEFGKQPWPYDPLPVLVVFEAQRITEEVWPLRRYVVSGLILSLLVGIGINVTSRYCDATCQRAHWPRHKGRCVRR